VRSHTAHCLSVLTFVTLTVRGYLFATVLREEIPAKEPDYAGTASFSFLADSISFWAMWVGTSS
jgi:hypothetical protein